MYFIAMQWLALYAWRFSLHIRIVVYCVDIWPSTHQWELQILKEFISDVWIGHHHELLGTDEASPNHSRCHTHKSFTLLILCSVQQLR
jgi:hypothetical protein